jgi:hypothetical protein
VLVLVVVDLGVHAPRVGSLSDLRGALVFADHEVTVAVVDGVLDIGYLVTRRDEEAPGVLAMDSYVGSVTRTVMSQSESPHSHTKPTRSLSGRPPWTLASRLSFRALKALSLRAIRALR